METLITSGVEITVETFYQEHASEPSLNRYLFAYHITINNHNAFPVQLMTRTWNIKDMNGDVRHVEGPGVVGRQPVLYPNDTFEYTSGCDLSTPFGEMSGFYLFDNKISGEDFEVTIPAFKLEAPQVLN